MTEAINGLTRQMATKADTYSDSWRRKVDDALSTQRGFWHFARWTLGLGIPAIGGLVGIAYYLNEIL